MTVVIKNLQLREKSEYIYDGLLPGDCTSTPEP